MPGFNDMNIDEIIEFVLSNANGQFKQFPAEYFIDAIKKNEKYGTLMQVRDDKGLAAVERWNWISEDEVKCLDCVVRKDMRGLKILKYIINLVHEKNRGIKYFSYDRLIKYPDSKTRRFKIGG